MTVLVHAEITFICEGCGNQIREACKLEPSIYKKKKVMEDHIICDECGFDNHVIEEM